MYNRYIRNDNGVYDRAFVRFSTPFETPPKNVYLSLSFTAT